MKKITIIFVIGLIQKIVFAQGITYLSNLGQSSSGSSSVGNDSWLAADFITGTNAGGYWLDSVQLGMTNASGTPAGFTAMLYSEIGGFGINPGTNLCTLSGSTDPSIAGIYTFTSVSNFLLSPSSYYFIVLTAETTVTNGAYEWSVTSTPSTGYTDYHWGGETLFAHSNNGLDWNYTSGIYGQFSITAEPIPEPGVLSLLAVGGLFFLRHCRKTKSIP